MHCICGKLNIKTVKILQSLGYLWTYIRQFQNEFQQNQFGFHGFHFQLAVCRCAKATPHIILKMLSFLLYLHIFTARKRSFHRCLSLQGGLCQGDLCPGDLCPGWSLSKWGSLSRGVSVQDGLCPGWSLSKWGSLSRGVSVQGSPSRGSLSKASLCPRGLCPGGSLSRGSLSVGDLCLWERGVSVCVGSLLMRPPYSKERVVRILLKCILVLSAVKIKMCKFYTRWSTL